PQPAGAAQGTAQRPPPRRPAPRPRRSGGSRPPDAGTASAAGPGHHAAASSAPRRPAVSGASRSWAVTAGLGCHADEPAGTRARSAHEPTVSPAHRPRSGTRGKAGALVRSQRGQANGDIRNRTVGVRQVGLAEKVGALVGVTGTAGVRRVGRAPAEGAGAATPPARLAPPGQPARKRVIDLPGPEHHVQPVPVHCWPRWPARSFGRGYVSGP